MTNLNDAQRALLGRLEDADLALRTVKASAEVTAARMVQENIAQHLLERDKLAAECHRAGIPKRRIAFEGLHTRATAAATTAIEHGEPFLPAPVAAIEAPVVAQGTFSHEGENVWLVSLSAAEIAPFAPFLADWDGAAHAWEFLVEGGKATPVYADGDATWTNPVVQVVMAADKTWQNRLLAHVAAHADTEGE